MESHNRIISNDFRTPSISCSASNYHSRNLRGQDPPIYCVLLCIFPVVLWVVKRSISSGWRDLVISTETFSSLVVLDLAQAHEKKALLLEEIILVGLARFPWSGQLSSSCGWSSSIVLISLSRHGDRARHVVRQSIRYCCIILWMKM
jgi:hypothetical protein